jgi:hypothetical protein
MSDLVSKAREAFVDDNFVLAIELYTHAINVALQSSSPTPIKPRPSAPSSSLVPSRDGKHPPSFSSALIY